MTNPTVLVTRETVTDLHDITDLKGRSVAIVCGYYYEDTIRRTYPEVKIVPVENFLKGLETVVQGKVDSFIGSQTVVYFTIKQHFLTGFRIAGNSGIDDVDRFKFKMAVQKESPILAAILNKGMESITLEEKQKLVNRWIEDTGSNSAMGHLELSFAQRDWLETKGEFRLGSDFAWPPFEFLNENGELSGIAAGYVEAVSKRLNIKTKIVKGLTWTEAMNEAKEKRIDILPAINRSKEREAFLNLTKHYISFPMDVATRKDSPFIDSLDDLAGKKVGVVKGYIIEGILRSEYPALVIDPQINLSKGMAALNEGRIDAFFDNLGTITYEIDRAGLDNVKIAAPTSHTFNLAMGVRKDWPELVEMLDIALDSLSRKEKTAIKSTWMAINVNFGTDLKTILVWAVPSRRWSNHHYRLYRHMEPAFGKRNRGAKAYS